MRILWEYLEFQYYAVPYVTAQRKVDLYYDALFSQDERILFSIVYQRPNSSMYECIILTLYLYKTCIYPYIFYNNSTVYKRP